ncbi:RNA binding protein [Strigomonas culicis]|uniref:RNA binding protein n=1 Tax=Strigomonas culicis TaxID=28005 RepID=S9U9I4_9TRYP|nr:RNA binding protein [Strigomonas culicis]|eukprot:EPY25578.1 RNA binding protein [Strigomonas culicis]
MKKGAFSPFDAPQSGDNMNPQAAYRSIQDHSQNFTHELKKYEQHLGHMVEWVSLMKREVETLHRHYEEVLGEKRHIEQLATKAEEDLQSMQAIIERYTVVNDAVVASDGYTYERDVIMQYIQSCLESGTQPESQQTRQVLTTQLIPNRSLKTLLDRLSDLQKLDTSYSGAKGSGSNANADFSNRAGEKDGNGNVIEVNAKGERLHPCIRVYGYCNYKDSCAYAKYPYDACLSNLKGKCRFRNQCHERHVDFRGPLNNNGEPIESSSPNGSTSTAPNGSVTKEKNSSEETK